MFVYNYQNIYLNVCLCLARVDEGLLNSPREEQTDKQKRKLEKVSPGPQIGYKNGH